VVLQNDREINWIVLVRNEVLYSQGGEEYPAYNKEKEGELDWSQLAQEVPSKNSYLRKDRRKK
jgi:hypothetical protein